MYSVNPKSDTTHRIRATKHWYFFVENEFNVPIALSIFFNAQRELNAGQDPQETCTEALTYFPCATRTPNRTTPADYVHQSIAIIFYELSTGIGGVTGWPSGLSVGLELPRSRVSNPVISIRKSLRFSESKSLCCLSVSLSVCPTPVCMRTHTKDHVRTL